MSALPHVIAAAMAAELPPRAAEDKLDRVRAVVRRQRDLELEASDLEARLTATKEKLKEMKFVTLPSMMDEAQLYGITLQAEGNLPGYEAKVKPYYKANIAADWDEDRRNAGFDYLVENHAEDLIRVVVSVAFGKKEFQAARELEQRLSNMGLSPESKMMVPWATLTSWLKEQVEVHGNVPPLELLGATVARVVELKPIKE